MGHPGDDIVEISDWVEIQEEAFKESNLKRVMVSAKKIGYGAFWNCRQLVHVDLCQGLQEISDLAFCGCHSLQTISVPITVVEIGKFAFQECTSLKNFDFSTRLELLGQYAFAHCKALSHISVPSTVKVIQNHCFSYCGSLLAVELKEGLTHIGEYAFLDCFSLSAIFIPKSTILIGAGAFSDCVHLVGVELSSSSININLEAFRYCYRLVNFYHPNLTKEDYGAFDGCSGLLLGMTMEEKCHRLQHRLDKLPVHRACYHASTITIDELVVAIEEAHVAGCDWKDPFGMSPFHILATSAKLRTDLLQVLLAHYHLGTLSDQDFDGRTMVDNLIMNRVPKSGKAIQLILEKTLVAKFEMWGWNKELCNPLSADIESMEWGSPSRTIEMGEIENDDDWWEAEWQAAIGRRRQNLATVISSFERCVRIEVTSILELGLWKHVAQMAPNPKTNKGDRESSRMRCGAEVVIPYVIGYLGLGGENDERLGTISTSALGYDVSWLQECSRLDDTGEF